MNLGVLTFDSGIKTYEDSSFSQPASQRASGPAERCIDPKPPLFVIRVIVSLPQHHPFPLSPILGFWGFGSLTCSRPCCSSQHPIGNLFRLTVPHSQRLLNDSVKVFLMLRQHIHALHFHPHPASCHLHTARFDCLCSVFERGLHPRTNTNQRIM